MNTLSFRTVEAHRGLSIELLIDGQPLVELLGNDEDTLIPYYLLEGGLPLGYWGTEDPSIRCVGICVCGTIGCSNVECRVVREADEIVFRDFDGCVNPKRARDEGGIEFRVTVANYDSVMREIMRQVSASQGRNEQGDEPDSQ